MQETTATYRAIFADPHHTVETRLTIGETGVLMTERGETIKFGGTRILVADGGPNSGFDENSIAVLRTKARVFPGKAPSIGHTVAAEIDITMVKPAAAIPRQARLAPFVRLADEKGHTSEWIKKGTFFIDTRKIKRNRFGEEELMIHGFDAMLRAEADYPPSAGEWPAVDTEVVREIAAAMGVTVDPRTWAVMTHGYRINYPAGYSQREVLGILGTMYGGNWFMTDLGELRLALLAEIPMETRLLINEQGYTITFGGDRIRV